jgi:hypothetical protein
MPENVTGLDNMKCFKYVYKDEVGVCFKDIERASVQWSHS